MPALLINSKEPYKNMAAAEDRAACTVPLCAAATCGNAKLAEMPIAYKCCSPFYREIVW